MSSEEATPAVEAPAAAAPAETQARIQDETFLDRGRQEEDCPTIRPRRQEGSIIRRSGCEQEGFGSGGRQEL
jgi:hypothetical protein